LVTHPHYRKDNPMNVVPQKISSTAEWPPFED